MAKRKQQDFQKTKLKVGRRIPKGANETRTSFQTRKINLQEQIKETVGEPTLKELLSFMKSTDVKIKFDNLRRLFKFVSENEDTLSMFFPDVLKELGRTLQESEPVIRSEAISVLGKCAEILTDTQLKSFVVPLTSYLNCMMTHITHPVKQDSLKFLDVLLKSHPSVICQSLEILFYLLDMISSKESSTGKRGSKNKGGRSIRDHLSSKISAEEWRMDVLKRMLTFLKGIVPGKNSSEMVCDDQKEVYWDAKEALYLPLYLNGGIQPANFDYSLYSSENLEGSNSKNFKTFINDLICILSAILKGFPLNRSFSEANINYFSIITQILCCIGEWAIENVDPDDDLNPAQNLISICCQLLRGFPYSLQSLPRSAKIEKVECVELNMEISYLYCMCSLLSDNPEKSYLGAWEVIKVYLANVFCVSGAKLNEKSISLALKITRVMIQCKNLDESAKNGMLIALLGTLHTNKFSSAANDLYTFFMKLSLDYDYKDFLASPAMREWFRRLIGNLIFMVESKTFVPNYLNYIKQVCARRNHYFLQTLNSLDSEKFIELLKFGGEDFQLTIIHLIVSMDKISPEFLQDLAETIRDASFSLKTASRLIRMLHSRFSKSGVPLIDQLDFVQFLLNLGCDTSLILDPSLDTDPLPLTDMLINFQQSFACQCEIYPTSDFERHQEIFEVCADCLIHYLRADFHLKYTVVFIRTIFGEHVRYPVHSVVAIAELFKRFGVLYNDIQLAEFLQSLIYSCLLYNSLITNDVPEDHWTEYCVPAVQECLDLVDPLEVIPCIENHTGGFKENQLYHVLRILLFLMQRRCLDLVNKNYLFSVFGKLRQLDVFPKRQVFKIMLHNLYEYLSSMCGN
ncbi:Testis-expressed protein 10 [Araneus ventricosus]|uniref:Testis-expressed protein 10 n=1 Tax=Araneus ventricosus TaxID=182803 RepID=A0A4Y2GVV3_ARAVE|nr:Testis-expressed protein 10 [Araneus ventricosus]